MVTSPHARLAVGWLTLFMVGTDLFIVSPLLPSISREFSVSAALAGLSATVFCVAYMIAAPMLGALADRVGRRATLAVCLIAFGGANLLTALVPDFAWLLGCRIAAGIAAAGVAPLVYAVVGEAAPPERRATWMALAVSGLLLALSLGAPVGAVAAAAWGWRMPFFALAGAGALLAGANQLVWPDKGAASVAAMQSPRFGFTRLAQRLTPTVLWATGLYGVYTYLGVGLTALGYGPAQIARSIALYGTGALAGTLLGGQAADRYGVFLTMRVSLVGLAGCLLAFGAVLGTEWMADLALLAASVLAQFFFPAQQAGLSRDFPAQRATVLAWNNSALFLGISLGSLVGGAVIEQFGFATTTMVCAGISAAALLSITVAAQPLFLAKKDQSARGLTMR